MIRCPQLANFLCFYVGPFVPCNVMWDVKSVGHTFCKHLENGAGWSPAGKEGKPILGMCVDFSQDKWLHFFRMKGVWCNQLGTKLVWRFGAMLRAQPRSWLLAGLDFQQKQYLIRFGEWEPIQSGSCFQSCHHDYPVHGPPVPRIGWSRIQVADVHRLLLCLLFSRW